MFRNASCVTICTAVSTLQHVWTEAKLLRACAHSVTGDFDSSSICNLQASMGNISWAISRLPGGAQAAPAGRQAAVGLAPLPCDTAVPVHADIMFGAAPSPTSVRGRSLQGARRKHSDLASLVTQGCKRS